MGGKKVLIADDHRVVIEGIKAALSGETQFQVVGEATSGVQAMMYVRSLRPDIVITDISMPDMNGIAIAMQIKKIEPNIRIIVFTMHSDREYVIDLFQAGINSYVLKEDPMTELIFAIKAAMHGGVYLSEKVHAILQDHIRELAEGKKDLLESLSIREREVFLLLAEGLAIKDISEKLCISNKTVESHKYNIMEKMNVGSIIELTKIAIRKNLIKI